MYIRVPVPTDHTLGESASLIEGGLNGSLTGLGQALTPLIRCGVDMDDVDVKLRVFIPSPAIKFRMPGAYDITGGDNRGYSYKQGTHRAIIHACVKLPRIGDPHPSFKILERNWGCTKAYPASAAVAVPGVPAWYVDIQPGKPPANEDRQKVTNDNLRIGLGGIRLVHNAFSVTSKSTVFSLHVNGRNPLISVAPPINADLNLYLKREGDMLRCFVDGEHDGFPAYELYVNGVLIYCHDPIAAGKSPASLFGQGDIKVNTGWIDIQLATGQIVPGQICKGPIARSSAVSR